MIIIDDIEQGTPEWLALRAGIPTASCFSQIVTTKGVASTSQAKYILKLVAEYLVGPQDGYSNANMDRGNEVEPEARDYYTFKTGNKVEQVALIYKDEQKLVSCSPDGLVEGHERGVEIKCPMASTQVKRLLDDKLPTEYICQVQGSMFVTGLKKWDFLSYFPGMPSLLIEVERDDDFIKKLEAQLALFISKMLGQRTILDKLKG